MYRLRWLVFQFFLAAIHCQAETSTGPSADPNTIRMAIYTPGYTNPPAGINGVLAHVMAKHGIKTEFYLVPSKRMPWSLKGGDIDTMQASALARSSRSAGDTDSFIQSEMPVFSDIQ